VPESRETYLWRAVIDRAVLDAMAEVREVSVVTRKGRQRSREEICRMMFEAERERDAARRGLLGDSTDFRLVCDFAGFDPDDARENAERLAAGGWKMGGSCVTAPNRTNLCAYRSGQRR
jgi:hypothetical protein